MLFDLDGTLADSELLTDRAIRDVMKRHGHPGVRLPPRQTRGRTWDDIAAVLRKDFALAASRRALAAELAARWADGIDSVKPIPGARGAVARAARHVRIGVVSSSPAALVERLLARILGGRQLDRVVPPAARISADDVTRGKPHPEGYLLAARRLGVKPAECLVFEDSRAGLEAARAAGMRSAVVLHRCAEPTVCKRLASLSFRDYRALPAGFFRGPR